MAQVIIGDRATELLKAQTRLSELEAVSERTPKIERQIASWRRAVEGLSQPLPAEIAAAARSADAQRLLESTDHVEYRIATPERTPSPAWLAWREQLREVVRGVRMEIPEEPQRYTDAPTPPLMPADLAALALPDESLADLKVRLLTELTRLRSMAVGRLDMTDAERAMLTTLEGQVAQQWFSS